MDESGREGRGSGGGGGGRRKDLDSTAKWNDTFASFIISKHAISFFAKIYSTPYLNFYSVRAVQTSELPGLE